MRLIPNRHHKKRKLEDYFPDDEKYKNIYQNTSKAK
jgi:hypothetical protein